MSSACLLRICAGVPGQERVLDAVAEQGELRFERAGQHVVGAEAEDHVGGELEPFKVVAGESREARRGHEWLPFRSAASRRMISRPCG